MAEFISGILMLIFLWSGLSKYWQKSSKAVLPITGSQCFRCHESIGSCIQCKGLGTSKQDNNVCTFSRDAISCSCFNPPRPNAAFKSLFVTGLPEESIESIWPIALTRFSAHLGSAALRMISKYCQFSTVACVIAGSLTNGWVNKVSEKD